MINPIPELLFALKKILYKYNINGVDWLICMILCKRTQYIQKIILQFYFAWFIFTNNGFSNFLFIFVFRMHILHWMVLEWFWIGFGLVAILIYQSLNNHLFALYMPYIYKGIWHIKGEWMKELLIPKPIQNRSKTNWKLF